MQEDIVLGNRWRKVVMALPKAGEKHHIVDVRLSHSGGPVLHRVAILHDANGDMRLLIPPTASSKVVFESDIEAITESKME